jgi:hypothetical protein
MIRVLNENSQVVEGKSRQGRQGIEKCGSIIVTSEIYKEPSILRPAVTKIHVQLHMTTNISGSAAPRKLT